MGLAGGQLLGLLSEVAYMLTYPPQTKKSKKKAKKTVQGPPATTSATESSAPNGTVTSSAAAAAAAPANETGSVTKRHLAPQVEDVEDE
jgi:hypothetical protein